MHQEPRIPVLGAAIYLFAPLPRFRQSNPWSGLLKPEPWFWHYQSLRQFRSSIPCSIKQVSISLISARTLRPTSAPFWASCLLVFVYLPWVVWSAAILFRPACVLGPVDLPPWRVHRPVFLTAGRWHSPPSFVRAPQRIPVQSGPKRVCNPTYSVTGHTKQT